MFDRTTPKGKEDRDKVVKMEMGVGWGGGGVKTWLNDLLKLNTVSGATP